MMNFATSFLGRWRSHMRRDPVRDWFFLLTLSALVLVCMVLWNIWAFDTVAQGGVIGSKAIKAQPAFNQNSLDSIHAVFQKRADEEAKYVTGVYRYNDPSQ